MMWEANLTLHIIGLLQFDLDIHQAAYNLLSMFQSSVKHWLKMLGGYAAAYFQNVNEQPLAEKHQP